MGKKEIKGKVGLGTAKGEMISGTSETRRQRKNKLKLLGLMIKYMVLGMV